MLEKVQSRMTPSFSHPRRTPLDQLRKMQFATVTLSQGLFSASERLFARKTMESSPVSIMQFEIVTSREQFTWIPSLFG
jgi:hypothetical protein